MSMLQMFFSHPSRIAVVLRLIDAAIAGEPICDEDVPYVVSMRKSLRHIIED